MLDRESVLQKTQPLLYVEKISKDTFNEHILQKEHHDDYDHKKVQEEDLGLEMGFLLLSETLSNDNKNHTEITLFAYL